MLADALKYDGDFTLQTKSDGPVRLIVADVSTEGTVRCYAQYDRARLEALSVPGAGRAERTVTRNLTLHYDRMMLLLDPTSLARGLVRKKVEVVNYPDGRFAVQFNGATFGFRVFDKIQTVQPGAIVDNKRLSAVLEQVKAQQAAYPPRQQRGHIARQRPPNNLEAGSAVEGTGTTPRCCRGCGLRQGPDRGLIATAALLGRRYAPEWPPASRPPSRRG